MRQRRLSWIAGGVSLGTAGLIAMSATPASAVPPHPGRTTIVVSPSGNDHNQGTPRRPLRTLAAAQAMARRAVQAGWAVTVELRDGTY